MIMTKSIEEENKILKEKNDQNEFERIIREEYPTIFTQERIAKIILTAIKNIPNGEDRKLAYGFLKTMETLSVLSSTPIGYIIAPRVPEDDEVIDELQKLFILPDNREYYGTDTNGKVVKSPLSVEEIRKLISLAIKNKLMELQKEEDSKISPFWKKIRQIQRNITSIGFQLLKERNPRSYDRKISGEIRRRK